MNRRPSALQKVTAEDMRILALTIDGEAEGEPFAGKVGVAFTVINRCHARRWWGEPDHTISTVCLFPSQFTCWSEQDGNPKRLRGLSLEKDSPYRQCLAAAAVAVHAMPEMPDPVAGATHYHAKYIETPWWVKNNKPVAEIGQHLFYAEIL